MLSLTHDSAIRQILAAREGKHLSRQRAVAHGGTFLETTDAQDNSRSSYAITPIAERLLDTREHRGLTACVPTSALETLAR